MRLAFVQSLAFVWQPVPPTFGLYGTPSAVGIVLPRAKSRISPADLTVVTHISLSTIQRLP